MKKLLTLLSFVLVITVVKAQQTAPAANQAPATSTSTSAKQSQGITKESNKSCTSNGKCCKEMSKKDCAAHCTAASQSSSQAAPVIGTVNVQSSSPAGANSPGDMQISGSPSSTNAAPQVAPVNEPRQEDSPKK